MTCCGQVGNLALTLHGKAKCTVVHVDSLRLSSLGWLKCHCVVHWGELCCTLCHCLHLHTARTATFGSVYQAPPLPPYCDPLAHAKRDLTYACRPCGRVGVRVHSG